MSFVIKILNRIDFYSFTIDNNSNWGNKLQIHVIHLFRPLSANSLLVTCPSKPQIKIELLPRSDSTRLVTGPLKPATNAPSIGALWCCCDSSTHDHYSTAAVMGMKGCLSSAHPPRRQCIKSSLATPWDSAPPPPLVWHLINEDGLIMCWELADCEEIRNTHASPVHISVLNIIKKFVTESLKVRGFFRLRNVSIVRLCCL
jgi:hypothetical protein